MKYFIACLLLFQTVAAQEVSGHDKGLSKGYRGILSFTYIKSADDFQSDKYSFDLVNGYQTNDYFMIGIGAGWQKITGGGDHVLPLYLQIKGLFNNHKNAPYAALSVGYSWGYDSHFNPLGLYIHPTAGFSFALTEKLAIDGAAGYELQSFSYRGWVGTNSDVFKAITASVGLAF